MFGNADQGPEDLPSDPYSHSSQQIPAQVE